MKPFNAMKRYGAKIATAGTSLALSGMAMAQDAGVDVTPVVTEITASKASIGLIGTTVLGVIVALAVFVWIRRAIK